MSLFQRIFRRNPDLVNSMTTESFLDLLAIRLNPAKIGDQSMTLMLDITDTRETVRVDIENSVLVGRMGASAENPDVRLTATRGQLMGLFLQQMPLQKMQAAGLKLEGDSAKLLALQSAIEIPRLDFPLITR